MHDRQNPASEIALITNPLRRVFQFLNMNISDEAVSTVAAKAATKAAPPAVVAGLNSVGITLPELVQLVSLVWLLILIVDKLWSFYRQWKKERGGNESV